MASNKTGKPQKDENNIQQKCSAKNFTKEDRNILILIFSIAGLEIACLIFLLASLNWGAFL